MAEPIELDTREITVTPLFRYESVEDINASERAGHLVKNMIQVVEVRFAGSKNYSPVFPVDAMWKRENGKVITLLSAGQISTAHSSPEPIRKPQGRRWRC